MPKTKTTASKNVPNPSSKKIFQGQDGTHQAFGNKWNTGKKHARPSNGHTEQVNGQKRKFDEKSKKRKTFLGRCRRLLDNMMELDDSIPFREPVDKLKYPDYHMVVRYDIDLGRIGNKLTTGNYSDPYDFGRDVRLMATNWIGYIKDQSLPIYSQITRLSWWFETEFGEIIMAYDKHMSVKKRRLEGERTSSGVPGTPELPVAEGLIPTPPHLLSTVQKDGRLRITRIPGQTNSPVQPRKTNPQDLRNQLNQSRGNRIVINPAPTVTGSTSPVTPVTSASMLYERLGQVLRQAGESTHPPSRRAITKVTSATLRESVQTVSMAQSDPPAQRTCTSSSITSNMPSRDQRAMGVNAWPARTVISPGNIAAQGNTVSTSSLTSRGTPVSTSAGTSTSNTTSESSNSLRLNAAPVANISPRNNLPVGGTTLAFSRTLSANTPSRAGNNPPTSNTPPRACNNSATSKSLLATPTTSPPELELLFSATYVWYGEFKNKPSKDIKFTEHCLSFPLKDNNNEAVFRVQASDIVRCCGHFGNIGKLQNTLFIFLTPAATKRLRACAKRLGVTLEVCSLIVIFGQNLTTDKISRLIHIFWVMSRQSIYGQLFSEVNKIGALSILANIKPQIQQKLLIGAQNVKGSSGSFSTGATSPSTAGIRPNLSVARVRRNSSTDMPISSSTASDHTPTMARITPSANLGRPENSSGFTFQRSRLHANQESRCMDAPSETSMGTNDSYWMGGPHPVIPYDGETPPWGPRNDDSSRHQFSNRPPQFGANQRRFGNANYHQPYQHYNQNRYEGNSVGPLGDYAQGSALPWSGPGSANNSYFHQHYNSFADLVNDPNSHDYTQDVNIDVLERNRRFGFCRLNPNRNNHMDMQQRNSVVEPNDQDEQPAGISSSNDQQSAHDSSMDSTAGVSTLRSVEVVQNTDRVLIRFSQHPKDTQQNQPTITHGEDHSDEVPPLLTNADYVSDGERNMPLNLESNVSSTDQTLDSGETIEMPQLSRADHMDSTDVTAQEPVSSSAPVDLSCEVIRTPGTPCLDDTDASSHLREAAPDSQPTDFDLHAETEPMDVNETIPLSDDDDDLEIIIPSDTDDELAFVPAKPDKVEDGEDLVMMATRISTRCPVTQQVMRRPVKNRHCGHCYDRDGIQQLIINRTTKARCPVPGCTNPTVLVMSDMDLELELFEYIRTHTTDPELQKALDEIRIELGSSV